MIPSGLGSKAVAHAFAPLLSARLHALYDDTVGDALPGHWVDLIAAAEPASTGTESAEDRAERDAAIPSPLRILLVEDDGLIRLTTASLLRGLGHLVHEVGDGEEAMASLQEQAIDLMITDVNLPGFSGVELARRALTRVPSLRIIFATGLKASVLGEALHARALLMAKPYGESELRSAVDRVIRL